MGRYSDKVLFLPDEFGDQRQQAEAHISRLKKGIVKIAKNRTGAAFLASLLKRAPETGLSLAMSNKFRFTMAHLLTAHPDILAGYFKKVQRFALFLAFARSGHSIMAHLLTSHPAVQICDELGALSRFDKGYTREQVYALIKFQDLVHIRRGRIKSGYDYQVSGLWQNAIDKYPEVIGDAKGAQSIRLFGRSSDFLTSLHTSLKIPIRVIVHLRNPFDSISTTVIKRNLDINIAVSRFINNDQLMCAAYQNLLADERLVQRHEDVVNDPAYHFTRMFDFLEVDPLPEVVEGCSAKIWKKPNLTRHKIEWPRKEIECLEAHLRESDLFRSYSYDK